MFSRGDIVYYLFPVLQIKTLTTVVFINNLVVIVGRNQFDIIF